MISESGEYPIEIWTAIAAFFAAFTSLFMYLLQRQSFLISIRPEIALDSWERKKINQTESSSEKIIFSKVRNVGNGAAHRIYINAIEIVDDEPQAMMSTIHIPLLSAGEELSVEGDILIFWKNIAQRAQRNKTLSVNVEIYCWDSGNRRYHTEYRLFVAELLTSVGVANPIAPNVGVSRKVSFKSVWLLKLSRELRKFFGSKSEKKSKT